MHTKKFEKTDTPGIFKLTIDSKELKNDISPNTALYTRYNSDGRPEGAERLPIPLPAQLFTINGEKYEVTGYTENLIQGYYEIYLAKYIKTKPEMIKNPIPVWIRENGVDYRYLPPLDIMVYNDMWNDISISLRNIKDTKRRLDDFIRWKRDMVHVDHENKIRFFNDEEAAFDDKINEVYRKIRGVFEKIPMSFIVSNYTNQLTDSERQSQRPKANFKNLQKTNPYFEYPIPVNMTETKESITITPYKGDFLTQKIIEKKYGYCGRTGHIPNPIGNKKHEVGHTNMDRYDGIDYFIELIEPLVNCHVFTIREGKPSIFMYVTGRFKTQMSYPYGEISTACVKLENNTYDDVKENGYRWPLHSKVDSFR